MRKSRAIKPTRGRAVYHERRERERSSRGVVSHSLVAQSTWNGRPLRGQSACRMQPRPLFGCAQARIARGEATARQHRHDAEQRASAHRGLRTVPDRLRLVRLPHLGHVFRERIVGVGRGEQRLDREEHRPDLKRRAPLVLQNVCGEAGALVSTCMRWLHLSATLT